MFRHVTFLFVAAFMALSFGQYINAKMEAQETAQVAAKASQPTAAPRAQRIDHDQAVPAGGFGTEYIQRNPRGHYTAEFRLNRHRIEGLIDTGATTIAINETTARKAGFFLHPNDFKYDVSTANGTVKGAAVVLDMVEVGSIRVRNVEALVLPDQSLNTVLIGMSFMNRLRGFEYRNGDLVLRL
ncbi:MAG: TIGR02281 family clan AA aspartic protease [Pseudomonadota bacterium]